MADGAGGPVMLHPPPRMYSLPSATCAESASIKVTRMPEQGSQAHGRGRADRRQVPDCLVRLLSEVGLVEQTGGLRAAGLVEHRVDALLERDAHAVGLGVHLLDALPQRLVGLFVANALEHRPQLAGILARARRDEGVVRELELLDVADERALGAVDLLALGHPALVED